MSSANGKTPVRFAFGQAGNDTFVVATRQGSILALLLADQADQAEALLRQRLAGTAPLVHATDAGFGVVVDQVRRLLLNEPGIEPPPLAPDGTAFQKKVWTALREIPPGSTMTYTELARQLGSVNARRAVAQACGANPIAVLVPCHRVIRADGGLGGYRWGLARKKALLKREQATLP
jgi:AraC family transcriptional regulator of adaptative response/methylated-DNA-[protein]-cysteine methyltransferase